MAAAVANEQVTKYEIEEIPDDAILYMRVHNRNINAGEVDIGVFRDIGEGMSVDWNKYARPIDTRNRAQRKPPKEYAVISLRAREIRSLGLIVKHTPSSNNQSHAEVFGKKTIEVREKLSELYQFEISLNS